ncbi:MAG TPA: hypothetical protein VNL15_02245 [Dehalococcoidia bacterium]|nr:hypothetical protein [Dehalococcoidia bacterium]
MRQPKTRPDPFGSWLLAAGLIISLAGFFAAFNVVQLTAEGTGEKLLRRAVALLTDIDSALPSIQEELQQEAENSSDPTIEVPNFPISITIPRQEAQTLSEGELRERLLTVSAEKAYDDGLGILASADPEASRDISLLSSQGAVDRGLGQITGGAHLFWIVITVVLGVLTLFFGVLLLGKLAPASPPLVAGIAVLIASLPSLAVALALRFTLTAAQGGNDPFVEGMLDLGEDALWIPIRNYIAISLLGLALTGLGLFSSTSATPGRMSQQAPLNPRRARARPYNEK